MKCIFRLPDEVSFDEGAVVDPASIALHVARRGNIKAGDTVVVTGAGAIGLLAGDAAFICGAARVIVVGRGYRLEKAAAMGFETVDTNAGDPVAAVRELTGGLGADVVLECAGVPGHPRPGPWRCCAAAAAAPWSASRPRTSRCACQPLVLDELELVGSRASAGEMRRVMPFVANGRMRVGELITHQLPAVGVREGARRLQRPLQRRHQDHRQPLTGRPRKDRQRCRSTTGRPPAPTRSPRSPRGASGPGPSWVAPTCWSGCGTTPSRPDLLVDLKGVDRPARAGRRHRRRRRSSARRTRWASWSPTPSSRSGTRRWSRRRSPVGSVAIRNRASLVANSCNASPAADTAPPLLVHGARVTIASLDGERTASLRRVLPRAPADAVRSRRDGDPIELPRPAPGSGSAFRRLTRRRGVDLATVSVAAGVDRDGGLVLGMGAVGPRPLRTEVPGPVDLADEAALGTALDRLVSAATPISDVRRQPRVPARHAPRPHHARGPRRGGPIRNPQGDGVMTTTTTSATDELQTVT